MQLQYFRTAMAIPGIGDAIAVIDKCIQLAKLLQTVKNAPIEFQDSVRTLQEVHATFLCLSQEIDDHADGALDNVSGLSASNLDRLSHEMRSANTALEQSSQILLERYAEAQSPSNSHFWRKARRGVRWRGTREQFEKQLEIVSQCLNRVNALVGMNGLYVASACRHTNSVVFHIDVR